MNRAIPRSSRSRPNHAASAAIPPSRATQAQVIKTAAVNESMPAPQRLESGRPQAASSKLYPATSCAAHASGGASRPNQASHPVE